VLIVSTFERTRAGHGAVSARERTAEAIADDAVDRHLADQLLVPAALLAARRVPPPAGVVPATRFTVSAVTKHLTTNADVIRRFLDVEVSVLGKDEEEGEVRVQPPGGGAEVVPLAREREPG
jgi:RNA 3'-terminal phosphate cyclase (ATP)